MTELEIQKLKSQEPFLWLNRNYQKTIASYDIEGQDIITQAAQRLDRFKPLLSLLFPELEASSGLIESNLLELNKIKQEYAPDTNRLLLKADHDLPVVGSIKARGGIHEVLCFAEEIALTHELIESYNDDYKKLASAAAKEVFGQYEIVVGSTGNLGLSVGISGSALGFNCVVHMSVEAKAWKKDLLRQNGVTVVEHSADYSAAVAQGRRESQQKENSYFVDDETSTKLFAGYAVAARRLEDQLSALNVTVNAANPLFVYLPAGVGEAPGGITFGLKQIFGANVHCFFVEPVQAPCMLLGLAGGPGSEPLSVYDYGLNIDTEADGLAVGRASKWVCEMVRDLVSGVITVSDDDLFRMLLSLHDFEAIEVEPSAAAGLAGPGALFKTSEGLKYLADQKVEPATGSHIVWTTGGSLVPADIYQQYLAKAKSLT